MSIQYPDGTIVSTTFVGAVKQDIVSNLETQLVNAGWSVVSGAGTTDVLLQSATTPTAGNYIRVRLRSTNLTNCASINLQNTAADRVSQNYFLLPAAAKTFHVVANKYQFFCFTPGTTVAREFVGMGTLNLPSFLHGVVTGELGWISGNANTDTATGTVGSFRTALTCCDFTGLGGQYYSGLCNANIMNTGSGSISGTGGALRLVTQYGAFVAASASGYRWHDDTLQIADPLIAWGLTAPGDEAKIRGQLWGAMIVTDSFAGGTVLTAVDGHDWYAITNSNVVSAGSARGTLFVAIT